MQVLHPGFRMCALSHTNHEVVKVLVVDGTVGLEPRLELIRTIQDKVVLFLADQESSRRFHGP